MRLPSPVREAMGCRREAWAAATPRHMILRVGWQAAVPSGGDRARPAAAPSGSRTAPWGDGARIERTGPGERRCREGPGPGCCGTVKDREPSLSGGPFQEGRRRARGRFVRRSRCTAHACRRSSWDSCTRLSRLWAGASTSTYGSATCMPRARGS